MNSYTSNFKKILFGLFLISLYELSLYSFLGNPSIFESNIFERHIIKPDNRSAFVVATKIEQSLKKNYKYIQIGGSGGLHGVKPNLISNDYYNASCCRSTSLEGYGHIGNHIINKLNKKYGNEKRELIYVLSPFSIITNNDGPNMNFANLAFAKLLYNNLLSKKGQVLNSLPSQNLRPPFSLNSSAYKSIKLNSEMSLKGFESSEKIYLTSHKNNGYIPFYSSTKIIYPSEVYFKDVLTNKVLLIDWAKDMAQKGNDNNYTFTVVFLPSPIPINEKDLNTLNKIAEEIQKIDNITVMQNFINDKNFLDFSKWGDNVHMSPIGAESFSLSYSKSFNEKRN